MFTAEMFCTWMFRLAEVVEEQKEYLTALDAAIGDGDHGINMARGFAAVREKLAGAERGDLGLLANLTGMALLSTVGGAAGPLYGTVFLKMSVVWKGKSEISGAELAAGLQAASDGLRDRGKAEVGDKTMVDVWEPVTLFLASHPEPTETVLAQAARLAQRLAEGTRAIAARKGRASYLGERSIGTQDPGATSSRFFFETLAIILKGGYNAADRDINRLP